VSACAARLTAAARGGSTNLHHLRNLEITMNTMTVFCSACEKDVHLACTAEPLHQGEANLPDGSELVCLTFGARCTAGRCPISGLPSVVMGVRLARSGLPAEEAWRTIHLRCEACDIITEMEVIDNVHAFCPVCQTTNRWFKMNMGEEEYVVAMPG
jgi:hypothetical protein